MFRFLRQGGSAVLGILVWALLGSPHPAYGQTPRPCDRSVGPRAECGVLSVFEDRRAGTGRRIDINYVVLRAAHQRGREPLFMFDGGPGQGSTGLTDLANGDMRPIRETRDIVLVDQRGTGRSNGLPCPTDVATNPAGAFGSVFSPAVFRECRTRLSATADLSLYGTELAVEDVDDVRRALGYDRILVSGVSYGTRFAQAYLRRFPERVGAAVIDGIVPFDFRAPADYARSLQRSLDRVLDDCAAAAVCRDSFPNVRTDWRRVLALVADGPAAATVRIADGSTRSVSMSSGDLSYAIRGVLYRPTGALAVPGMIHRAAARGDVSEFAQRYWERAADFGDFADGLHLSVLCGEDVAFIEDAEIPALVDGTFMGRYLIDDYRAACREWVTAAVDRSFLRPVTADVPVLVISGWFDPVTPVANGEKVARRLPNSRHLVIRNEAHGAGFRCGLPAVLHVLDKATLAGLPRVCAGVDNLWSR